MTKKQKLELTWIGKDQQPKLEPRILLEDDTKSFYAKHRVTDNDIFDNKLIFGDNLLALKALEQEYTGRVKCVYIDPPFNTGAAFEHYDDGIEHSIWLGLDPPPINESMAGVNPANVWTIYRSEDNGKKTLYGGANHRIFAPSGSDDRARQNDGRSAA